VGVLHGNLSPDPQNFARHPPLYPPGYLATKTPHLDIDIASSTKYGQFGNNFVAEIEILRHLSLVRPKPENRRGVTGTSSK
jgi:hypothetical protein